MEEDKILSADVEELESKEAESSKLSYSANNSSVDNPNPLSIIPNGLYPNSFNFFLNSIVFFRMKQGCVKLIIF